MSRATQRPSIGVIAALFLISFALPASAGNWFSRLGGNDKIEGSGVLETRNLDLDGFDSIRIEGVFEIEVTIGDEFRVELEAEDNIIDLVEAKVRRGQLVIDLDDEFDLEPEEDIRFTITMPALVEVLGEGVYELYASGLDNEETRVEANGVGKIELAGKTNSLRVEAGGVGSVMLRDLVAQNAVVDVSGVGKVEVFVEDELDANVDGMGKIIFFGEPRYVDDRVDGFGSIRAGD